MSAFVCIFDRAGADLDPARISKLAEPLRSYGERLSSFCRGPMAVAVRHEEGPRASVRWGPLVDPERGLLAAVAGQFTPLDEARDGAGGRLEPCACAAMALQTCAEEDRGFLGRVAGSFAVITADPGGGWLSLARDHLGDLKVYYYLDRRWLVAASEPAAILGHGAVADELDERAAARFLGFRFSHSERSFFRWIKELPPAHRLRVTAGESRTERYWRFRLDRDPHRDLEPDVPSEFKRLLRRSLSGQLARREPERLALSLSGGLDSTTLAALAPAAVKAFSWRFARLDDGGERSKIEAVAEHLNRTVHWIDGDDLYPLCGGYVERFAHPNSPHLNAFASLKHALYLAARAEGCRLVMVGDGGDALYSAQEYWLRDALSHRRPGGPARLLETVRSAWSGDRRARAALRRLLPVNGARNLIRPRRLPWLTATGQRLLSAKRPSPILPDAPRTRRFELVVGAKHTELESEERRLFAQCGVGRSNPFWYWPLLEMMIGLPAFWYHDDGRSKVLTREAMKELLPAAVLESRTVGLLGAFFLRGIETRKGELRATVFRHPRSDWQRYVERAWLEPYLDATESIRFEHTILWRVISYELWQRQLIGAR